MPEDLGTPADIKALNANGYNRIASSYTEFTLNHSSTSGTPRDRYLDKLLSKLPLNVPAHILELGCGTGVLSTRTLLERGHRVTATDISSGQIAIARENLKSFGEDQLTLLCADMTALSFPPDSLDAVIAFYSFPHLPQADQPLMIRKIGSWLKPGGLFLCVLLAERGDVVWKDFLGAKLFVTGFGRDENSEMIRTEGAHAGLKIVEDEVIIEEVQGYKERYQWVLVAKEKDNVLPKL